MLRKIQRAYRRGGIGAVVSAARSRFVPVAPKPQLSYQEKTAASLSARLELFDGAIPSDAVTALDIGCNLGDVTSHLARRGLWSVGVDIDRDLVESAIARHGDVGECAFMVMQLDPATVSRLPTFDVTMLLSVHHNWMNLYGPVTTGAMMRTLLERTRSVLVFEGAARLARYGAHPPPFIENDEESVTSYLSSFLGEHLGPSAARIELLGKTPCLGEREPYRWSWAVYPKAR